MICYNYNYDNYDNDNFFLALLQVNVAFRLQNTDMQQQQKKVHWYELLGTQQYWIVLHWLSLFLKIITHIYSLTNPFEQFIRLALIINCKSILQCHSSEGIGH